MVDSPSSRSIRQLLISLMRRRHTGSRRAVCHHGCKARSSKCRSKSPLPPGLLPKFGLEAPRGERAGNGSAALLARATYPSWPRASPMPSTGQAALVYLSGLTDVSYWECKYHIISSVYLRIVLSLYRRTTFSFHTRS